MQYLVIVRVKEEAPIRQVRALVKPEAAKIWEYYAEEKVRSVYYFADMDGVVLFLEAANLAEVEAAAQNFPMVEAGFLSTEIIPLKPYTGFASLFKT
jgi:uncharacterized protein YciI